jgi:hypothetical protein
MPRPAPSWDTVTGILCPVTSRYCADLVSAVAKMSSLGSIFNRKGSLQLVGSKMQATSEEERHERMVFRARIVFAVIGLPLLVFWLAQS